MQLNIELEAAKLRRPASVKGVGLFLPTEPKATRRVGWVVNNEFYNPFKRGDSTS